MDWRSGEKVGGMDEEVDELDELDEESGEEES